MVSSNKIYDDAYTVSDTMEELRKELDQVWNLPFYILVSFFVFFISFSFCVKKYSVLKYFSLLYHFFFFLFYSYSICTTSTSPFSLLCFLSYDKFWRLSSYRVLLLLFVDLSTYLLTNSNSTIFVFLTYIYYVYRLNSLYC